MLKDKLFIIRYKDGGYSVFIEDELQERILRILEDIESIYLVTDTKEFTASIVFDIKPTK